MSNSSRLKTSGSIPGDSGSESESSLSFPSSCMEGEREAGREGERERGRQGGRERGRQRGMEQSLREVSFLNFFNPPI